MDELRGGTQKWKETLEPQLGPAKETKATTKHELGVMLLWVTFRIQNKSNIPF